MPPPKSAGTCVQCRARKVRCSGALPCCANCERLEFDCSFADRAAPASSSSSYSSTARPEKRRRPLACLPCRANKSRCTGERPSCEPCRARKKRCGYPDAKRRPSRADTSSGYAPSSAAAAQNPSMAPPLSDQGRLAPAGPSPPDLLLRPPRWDEPFAAEPRVRGFPAEAASPLAGPSSCYNAALPTGTVSATWENSASSLDFGSPVGPGPGPEPIYPLPTVRTRLQMVNDYFRHLYAYPGYAFLSEVSVTKRCLDGTMDEALLLALCALTASKLRYPRYHPSHTAAWVQKAEGLLWDSIETPTVFRTQALLLAVLCRVETGNSKRAYMLLSVAARAASALRLQYERLDLDHQRQEVRRRLMWSIMMIDNYFSVGLPESGTCPPEFVYLKMPCREEDFDGEFATGASSTSTSLDGVPEDGLLSLYIRLSIVRRDVMRLSRHLSLQADAGTQIVGLVEDMLQSLKLAEPPPYSVERLRRYTGSRWLVRYIAVQIAWHQSHCDIYRLFLAGYGEAAPRAVIQACAHEYVARAAAACLGHARTVTDIIRAVHDLRLPVASPPRDVCIGGYHASRLLLFLSRSDLVPREQNIAPEAATSLARGTLAVLDPLFSSSATLGRTVRDLDAIIARHVSGAGDAPGDAPEAEERGRPRYAVAIQRHTRLAVHSALRHAQFPEDDEDAGDAAVEKVVVALGMPPRPADPSVWELNLCPARFRPQGLSPGSSHDCT